MIAANSHSKQHSRQRVLFFPSHIEGWNFTSIVIIESHHHAPGEIGPVVELLICAVQEADRGDVNGFEGHIVFAGTSVVAANVEAVLVLIAIAFDPRLEVVMAWWSDGTVRGYVDDGG